MFNPLNLITKFIKSSNQKELDRIGKIVNTINSLEDKFKKLDDLDFPKKTLEFKEQIKQGKALDELLPEAFALVREASKRTRNERHFDVQIIGGVVLHEGKIAEMRTGEGKTLTISLAAYLNALSGKGVHIVTVNDYLAKRDSIEMGQIYNFLGLSSGYINNDQNDNERKRNYNCDITYATNSELGFDYLRDNMKFSEAEMVQRDHSFSIVDEIDSCLIDEARTPLVISGSAEDKTAQYLAIDKLVRQLNEKDYEIDEKERSILLTNEGININDILPEAFALVREASKRTRGERHYDAQIIGGVVLHEGKIAEMRTGEGKTLTITLAAYLNALSEKGVHIVTVNDYLAKRDSIEMGQVYNFFFAHNRLDYYLYSLRKDLEIYK